MHWVTNNLRCRLKKTYSSAGVFADSIRFRYPEPFRSSSSWNSHIVRVDVIELLELLRVLAARLNFFLD